MIIPHVTVVQAIPISMLTTIVLGIFWMLVRAYRTHRIKGMFSKMKKFPFPIDVNRDWDKELMNIEGSFKKGETQLDDFLRKRDEIIVGLMKKELYREWLRLVG